MGKNWESDKRHPRLVWRVGGGGSKTAYGDFRDIGGGQESMRTKDFAQAVRRIRDRETQLLTRGVAASLGVRADRARLGVVAGAWFDALEVSPGEKANRETRLRRMLAFFGEDTHVGDLTPQSVAAWYDWLKRNLSHRSGRQVSETTLSHHFAALRQVVDYARFLGAVSSTFDPVSSIPRHHRPTPTSRRSEKPFLRPPEAAAMLRAARGWGVRNVNHIQSPLALLATFLYTGARRIEVFKMRCRDIDLELGRVFVPASKERSLGARQRHEGRRPVPLWGEYREIIATALREPSEWLFPVSEDQGTEGWTPPDVRKLFGNIGVEAGLCRKDGEWFSGLPVWRTRIFRHTYCATRLHTVDEAGYPTSKYVVASELGHGSAKLVDDIYGHVIDADWPKRRSVSYEEGRRARGTASASGGKRQPPSS